MSNVYAIQGVGTPLVKIGRATDPLRRLRELQIGSPVPLRLLASAPEGAANSERVLHAALAFVRRRGEWFELADEDAAAAVLGYGEFA